MLLACMCLCTNLVCAIADPSTLKAGIYTFSETIDFLQEDIDTGAAGLNFTFKDMDANVEEDYLTKITVEHRNLYYGTDEDQYKYIVYIDEDGWSSEYPGAKIITINNDFGANNNEFFSFISSSTTYSELPSTPGPGESGSSGSEDDHVTKLTYTVGESYKWSAPSDFTFTSNVDAETKTGTVSVLENIIAGGSTLKISIGPDEVFKLTSDEGSTRDYKLLKDSNELVAGSEVLAVPSGVNEATQDLNFALQGVVGGNVSQVAGTFRGTLNFVAGIETINTGTPSISVTKGQIVTLSDLGLTNTDMNSDSTDDTFRVLSVEGSQVKLLAMDSYKSAYFNNAVENIYSGSTLDTKMTEYYNALPSDVQNAIVEQNINQSFYSKTNSTSESADFSAWYKSSFTESDVSGTNYYLTRTTEANVGNRKVYALDVDDVIAYLGDSSTPQDVNKLFFNQRSSVSRNVWLRSAFANDGAFRVVGNYGGVDFREADSSEAEVHPAFVLNLG